MVAKSLTLPKVFLLPVSDKFMVRPQLAICRSPFIRDQSAYDNFIKKSIDGSIANEEEYEALVDKAFLNDPKDFIAGMNIATAFHEACNSYSPDAQSRQFLEITGT